MIGVPSSLGARQGPPEGSSPFREAEIGPRKSTALKGRSYQTGGSWGGLEEAKMRGRALWRTGIARGVKLFRTL